MELIARLKRAIAAYRRKFDNRRDDKGGFTLLEVLIAMAIATFSLLGMAMLQGTAIQANSFGNKYTQATMLAQSTIEDLNSEFLDADGNMVTNLTVGSGGVDASIDENGDPGGIFTRTWNVADYSEFSRLVTVQVDWTESGIARQVALSTITRGRGN
jgi:prepilin-type N-terminal cleavage/methylation domain-containing protein